ncbi:hypothetical protein C8R45DRAFT_930200 [Mycena sanguinolenta]|nr:hypothetical protein C8R45DRAFT_930200 [Mycena sanguinolenta]
MGIDRGTFADRRRSGKIITLGCRKVPSDETVMSGRSLTASQTQTVHDQPTIGWTENSRRTAGDLRSSSQGDNPYVPSESTPILFLDLPCELRLEIYDAVANLPLGHGSDCWVRTFLPRREATHLPISWFNLILICKTIANEIQHHTRQHSTYSLYVTVDNSLNFDTFASAVLWWRSLAHRATSARCKLICSSPVGCPYLFDPKKVAASKKKLWPDLQRCISRVVDRGVLFGAVDKIVCQWTDDGDTVGWEVRAQPIGDMTEWGKWNCNWGLPYVAPYPQSTLFTLLDFSFPSSSDRDWY